MEPIEVVKSSLERIEKAVKDNADKYARQLDKTHDEIMAEIEKQLEPVRAKIKEVEDQYTAISRNGSLPGVEDEKVPFSFHKAFRGMLTHDWSDSGVEKEVFDNMRKRAQIAGDGSSGGYLIPVELKQDIVEPAIAAMPLYGAGMQVMDGLVGNIEIPTLDSRGESGESRENTTLDEVSFTFGQKTMTPHRGGGYTKVSKRLIHQTGGVAETFIKGQLQKSFRLRMHKMLIQGLGTDEQVLGLENVTGMSTVLSSVSSATQIEIQHLMQMQTDLEELDYSENDQDGGRWGFLTRPIVLEGIKRQAEVFYSGQTTGKGFAFKPVMVSKSKVEEAIGKPIHTTTHVSTSGSGASTTSKLFYGDFSHCILGLWGAAELRTSDTASDGTNHAFVQNMIFVAMDQDYDFVVDLPAAFGRTSYAIADRSGFTNAV